MSQNRTPKFCWGCGAKLKEGQKFCTKCGKPVKFKKSEESSDPMMKTSKPKIPEPSNRSPPAVINEENPYQAYKPSKPESTPVQEQQPVVQQDLTPVIAKVDKIEKNLDELQIDQRFKKIEYKLNAYNVENDLIDLENKIDKIDAKIQPPEPVEIPENLATTADVQELYHKIEQINLDKLDELDRLKNLDRLDHIEDLDKKLSELDDKLSALDSAEKIGNLAKNTVKRLNSLEERLNNFNLENRKRLTRLDERLENMDLKIDRMSKAMESIVPSLVKLTQKLNNFEKNEVRLGGNSSSVKSHTHKTAERSKPRNFDLPPFPSVNSSSNSETPKKTLEPES